MSKRTALLALGLIALALLEAKLLLPIYVPSSRQARERIIQQDLITMRVVISQYTLDMQKRPHSLDDLIVAGYLKDLPTEPKTRRNDTWILECSKDPKTPGIVGIDATSGNVAGARTHRCD
jgi:competence protein ComGC